MASEYNFLAQQGAGWCVVLAGYDLDRAKSLWTEFGRLCEVLGNDNAGEAVERVEQYIADYVRGELALPDVDPAALNEFYEFAYRMSG